MNVKLITKALHTLSLLSEEDVTTVMNLRALSEDERELLITVLEPQKATTKRAGKKSSKGGSKSARASSLQQQLKGAASRTVTGPACGVCGNVEDHPDHDTAHYLSAHEFNTGKPAADIMAHEAGAGE